MRSRATPQTRDSNPVPYETMLLFSAHSTPHFTYCLYRPHFLIHLFILATHSNAHRISPALRISSKYHRARLQWLRRPCHRYTVFSSATERRRRAVQLSPCRRSTFSRSKANCPTNSCANSSTASRRWPRIHFERPRVIRGYESRYNSMFVVLCVQIF